MREEEYNKLKEIYDKYDIKIPEYVKTTTVIEKESEIVFSHNKVLLCLSELQSKPIVDRDLDINPVNALPNILKMYTQAYNVHFQNYQTHLAKCKKLATVCARECKRSFTKTAKTNPVLKSKRINKELNVIIKKAIRGDIAVTKSAERDMAVALKKQEEINEINRQKRKFNYLLSQTELFAGYFLNRKTSNPDLEGIKAAQEQMRQAAEFNNVEIDTNEAYIHKEVSKPDIVQAELRNYQLKGLNWLVSLYNQGINGILADDMGLGKTVQAISLLAYLYESHGIKGPFLVVCPSSTLHNWVNEFERFVPLFKIVSFWGTVNERKELRRKIRYCNVIITSYQIAITDESYIKKIKFQYMILDEAQAIKSNTSLRWRSLLTFKARSRLLLTGTPIQNNMTELWTLLHFIMPTLFDSLAEFSDWFSKEIESNTIDQEQVNKLHTILKPFMLRRDKNDIKNEIGTKEIVNVYCELSPRQKILYNQILNSKFNYENTIMHLKKVCNHPDLFEKLEAKCSLNFNVNGDGYHIENREKELLLLSEKFKIDQKTEMIREIVGNYIDPLVNIFKFRNKKEEILKEFETERMINDKLKEKFCFIKKKMVNYTLPSLTSKSSPVEDLHSYVEKHTFIPPLDTFIKDSGKLITMEKLLIKLKREDHRVLIYFQMTRMMDLFEEFLTEREYSYLRLDGSSKISYRKDVVEKWQNDESIFIFILSTRAGGVGLNLTAADTVIFYDSDWNPTVDQQAMDRVHRLGQTKNVTVYKLVVKDTIEERIMEMARKKDEIQKIVIQDDVFNG